MRRSSVIAIIFLALSALSCQASESPVLKATRSGICHDPASPNYKQIKDYVPYATMDACLASGGKPRQGSIESAAPPTKGPGKALYDSDDPSIIKKSRSNICYDSSSGRFTEIVHFTAYRTIEDCVADGGTRP